MVYPRRFPAPWRVEERDECYIVVDGSGQKLAHLYFEDEPIRQGILKRLGKDDAWRIARAITRIPALLRRDQSVGLKAPLQRQRGRLFGCGDRRTDAARSRRCALS